MAHLNDHIIEAVKPARPATKRADVEATHKAPIFSTAGNSGDQAIRQAKDALK
jgi:hypothetical protein